LERKSSLQEKENINLKDKLLQMDSYNRRENLNLSGVAEKKNEHPLETRSKIIDLIENKLEIADAKIFTNRDVTV
jgi:hypothetical protein